MKSVVQNDDGLKFLAIHLPQFHPIPENDKWWGKGFTEWTNVVRARPLFRGHYQPQLPADLGFYDMRLPETHEAQALLASEHGIGGFCYYHYWFHGRRVLERPVNEIIRSGRPDFPFCLFWANETWEGRWHGVMKEKRVLIEQKYSKEDDLNHIRWLAEPMSDHRYIRVEGRPVFLVYRPFDLPNCRATLELWRSEATRLGVENPFFIASDSHADGRNPLEFGFDGILQFMPQLDVFDIYGPWTNARRFRRLVANIRQSIFSSQLHVYDYEQSVKLMLNFTKWPAFRSLMPGWDNSPRSGKRGVILKDNSPENFERILREIALLTIREQPPTRRLVFLNAWNEWAEGNHLEPDQKFGRGFLEAVQRVNNDVWREIDRHAE